MKTQQNLLDGELKKMQTWLQRINDMIRRERWATGGTIGREFEKELDIIIDENTALKMENRKLKKTVQGLWAKLATANRRANARKSAVGYGKS